MFVGHLVHKPHNVVIGLLICLCCSSCASVYVSSLRNAPLLTKKGEFQGSASYGRGANVNVAYALTNHIGITAGGLYSNNRHLNWNNTYRKHQSAEIALGYFDNKRRISYETYAGYGGGHGYAQDSIFGLFIFANTQQTAEGTYHRFFIQPSFAFKRSRLLMAITARVSYVEFKEIVVMTDNANPVILRNRGSYIFEPSFTAKFFVSKKSTSMYVFAQAGFNMSDQSGENPYNMPIIAPHYNAGIGIRLLKDEP